MKSVVICEGNTDLTLIQYFMEKVHEWKHIKESDYRNFEEGMIHKIIKETKNIKWFQHDNGNIMCIIAAGGVSKITDKLQSVLDLNNLGGVKSFNNIVIISDRDEIGTEQEFITEISKVFSNFKVNFNSEITNDKWNCATFINDMMDQKIVEFLPLIIPFEDTGAIENFLLEALCDESEKNDPLKVDKCVIEQCIKFIDNIDCKEKYLKHRREITKAKFDTAFVVMTPAEAFNQRRNLLRGIPWENYEIIQSGFKNLNKLLEK